MQVLSPNKYVGWGILFVWFVGSHLPQQHGLFEPALHLRRRAHRAAQRFQRRRQLLDRAQTVMQFYWLCFARDPRRDRAFAVAARHRPRPCACALGACGGMSSATPLAIAGVAAVAMAATGAYAYHNIKQLNRYETSDEAEKYQRGL